jgi:hypothetical protein
LEPIVGPRLLKTMWCSIRRLIGTRRPLLSVTSTLMSVMWPSTIGFGGLNSSSRVSTW